VPLSEHEQRLLEQIEQALYAEDPKFASAVRARDLRSHHRRQLFRVLAVAVVGVAAVSAWVGLRRYWELAVAGAVVLVAAAVFGFLLWRRVTGRSRSRAQINRAERLSWRERLEARWARRMDDRGR
jgi:hypothetical protein